MARQVAQWKSAAARRIQQFAGGAETVEDAVRHVAAWLLEDVASPPTDLEAICAKVHIKDLVPEDFPIAGELRREGDYFTVAYSKHLSKGKRRFTIAHEVGHAVFQMTGPNAPVTGREIERICDMMAAEVLMPRRKFESALSRGISLDNIFTMSREFETSISATSIRCSAFRPISILEVDQHRVIWSCGKLRPRIHSDSLLMGIVGEMLDGCRVSREVEIITKGLSRTWVVEAAAMGKMGRGLLLFKPLNSYSQ